MLVCPLILSFIHFAHSSCVIDNTSDDRRWLKKLHKHLKNDYNNIMQPNRARTKVNFGFFLRYYNFDDESHTFTVNGWLHLTWSDDRLTWNPEDFNGINKTNYWSYVFWAPILELNNRIENEIYETFYGMCSLESTGSVTCNPRVNEEVRCVSSVQNWPYDTKKCKLDYGISSLQNNVGLMLFLKPILAHTTKTEWILSQHSVIRNVSKKIQIRFLFNLKRNSSVLEVFVVFPSIILMLLTLATILLEASFKRFLLTSFFMVSHFSFLSEINNDLPKYGDDVPTILLFYRSSLILNSILVVISIILIRLKERKAAPPVWVCFVNNLIFNTFLGCLVWRRWQDSQDMITKGSDNIEAWRKIANIFSISCFIVYVILYTVLTIVYIPRNI
uniref:Nicotinic acetylcholine receptor beta 2 subunit n=1 Tax=Chilo suppressalis TaxID=168631 RepID=A0A0H4U7U3_CHISP|nr:nicotinic acetylcholine receptor beta 2 subunit [Chilo suppressalis]